MTATDAVGGPPRKGPCLQKIQFLAESDQNKHLLFGIVYGYNRSMLARYHTEVRQH